MDNIEFNSIYWMQRALELARKGAHLGEIPVGAVITQGNIVIAEAHNEKEALGDPTAHAEIIAIQRATQKIQNWRLKNCTLYVTLEPCHMCLGAIVNSRIDKVVLGARDPKAGAIVSTYEFQKTTHFNHYPEFEFDILNQESSLLLKNFFADLRKRKS